MDARTFASLPLQEQFLPREELQKITRRSPSELNVGWQVAVQCMGNLIGVVADATKLNKQQWVHAPMRHFRRSLHPALVDELLA